MVHRVLSPLVAASSLGYWLICHDKGTYHESTCSIDGSGGDPLQCRGLCTIRTTVLRQGQSPSAATGLYERLGGLLGGPSGEPVPFPFVQPLSFYCWPRPELNTSHAHWRSYLCSSHLAAPWVQGPLFLCVTATAVRRGYRRGVCVIDSTAALPSKEALRIIAVCRENRLCCTSSRLFWWSSGYSVYSRFQGR